MERMRYDRLNPLLRSWFQSADDWSRIDSRSSSEDRVRARAIFFLGMLFVPLITCLPILSSHAEAISPFTASLTMVSIIGMVMGLLVLKFLDNPSSAGMIFCMSVSSALVLWPGLTDGVFAPSHVLLALTPLLWGLMVSARACLAYSFLLLAYVVVMMVYGPQGLKATSAGSLSMVSYYGVMLIIATIVSCSGTVGYALMTRHMMRELESKSTESANLAEENEAARSDAALAGERFRKFANIASDWLWETDARGRVTYFGGREASKLKRANAEIVGQHFMSILELRKHDLEDLRRALAKADAYCDIPAKFTDEDGASYIFELSATPRLNKAGKLIGYMGVGKDVTARVKAENDVRFLAANDKLTGLSNRHTFNARINDELDPTDLRGSVLFAVDLDDFKSVNDSYGHHVGDALLVEVAARINSCIRKGDWAARLGGDEFVVMAVDYDPCNWAVDLLANRLLEALAQPYRIEELELHMSASIGCARFPADAKNARSLTQYADMALYAAKQGGRNQWRAFTPAMRQVARQRKLMENELRTALDQGSLRVWYQPLINLDTNIVTGFEALARWTDGERGTVPPAIFIDVAEKCGLISELGEYVLTQACQDAAKWSAQDGASAPRVSVNISPIQFADGNLPQSVANILSETGLAPDRLELEITESVLMQDTENAVRVLEALEALGVGVAIDDFGTGYSSLSYLKRFPLNRLKVDRSFIHDLESDEHDRTITKTVVQLGESLGLSVIAEGVETEGQRAWLKSMGCEEVQGFLYAKPMPGNEIVDYLHGHADQTHRGASGIAAPKRSA
ncbi:MAG: EAL domain-containing protein [Pseudomonadota bacterium]